MMMECNTLHDLLFAVNYAIEGNVREGREELKNFNENYKGFVDSFEKPSGFFAKRRQKNLLMWIRGFIRVYHDQIVILKTGKTFDEIVEEVDKEFQSRK
jgi:hypothetical protein